jgi:hypothetical protein
MACPGWLVAGEDGIRLIAGGSPTGIEFRQQPIEQRPPH